MTTAEHTVPQEELMAYVDGELSSSQVAAIEAHVADCRACQKIVGDLRQVSRDLARWSIEAPPPRLAPQVRKSRFAWMPRLTVLPVATATQLSAAALVLVVGTMMWFNAEQRRQRPVTAAADARFAPAVGGSGGGTRAPEPRAAQPQTLSGRVAVSGQAREQSPATLVPETPTRSTVIRTASLTIVAKDFDAVRPAIERVLREAAGFVGQIQATGGRGDARSLTATLRVPSARFDATLASLRSLGQVIDENQSGEDVATQMVDLEARLKNSRNTESRLAEVLKRRTGDVGDVLEVEREIARVRGEIEQLDAQRKQLQDRVTYATVSLNVREERQAKIDTGTVTLGMQLRNAFVDGIQAVYASAAGTVLTVLRVAPVLVFWAIVLWWPVRRALRAMR
jgi:hypothetical protein